ncbi:uncharacterized protein UTRI_10651_B [Ustilago trichophora]|uniref:Uncharacterized protein n=1 Tax=Ustilago trichophora TaxID=86804 RepID=A0A5C3EDE7_9BASI|nr:uncharacterized protein UTRI_10651_B [Ustilago trichophora]
MSSKHSKPLVALIGTLDTKEAEYQFATSWLETHGCNVVILDASTQAPLEGSSFFDLSDDSKLYRPKELLEAHPDRTDAAFSSERSANTAFATSIMRDTTFPIGLPKFMLTTMASGDVSEYIGESDICIMPSVGDISGSLNAITLTTLQSALAAISGMAHARHSSKQRTASSPAHGNDHKPMIAISMFGVTTVAVNQISDLLKQQGYEPVAFHATGSGGRSMERLIREGFFAAVIDLTTTEICDHLYDGVLSAGPDRLIAAAEQGLPQVVSFGALDMINFGSLSSLPSRYKLQDGSDQGPLHHTEDGTPVYEHNSQVTLVRTSSSQSKELGEHLVSNLLKGLDRLPEGRKAAPIKIIFPKAGISAMDGAEGVWDDPEARSALLNSSQATLEKNAKQSGHQVPITIESHEYHINSHEFAEIVVEQAIQLLSNE